MKIKTNKLVVGEALKELRALPSNAVDCVITSPPYWMQREYAGGGGGNEETIEEYMEFLLSVFRECMRVVKPNGNVVFNLGDKYHKQSLQLLPHAFAISATKDTTINGVRLVNDITWVKKNPTPRQFSRRLVNATESFFHFAKSNNYYFDPKEFPISKEQEKPVRFSDNLGKGYARKIDESDLTEQQKEAAYEALTIAYEKVRDGEIAGFRMKIKGVHKLAFGGQHGGRASQMRDNGFTVIYLKGQKMKKDVIEWGIGSNRGVDHPATFPVGLVEAFVKMLCPPQGVVLDPFIGSGSTALAAIKQGRKYLGIDISEKYIKIAQNRVDVV